MLRRAAHCMLSAGSVGAHRAAWCAWLRCKPTSLCGLLLNSNRHRLDAAAVADFWNRRWNRTVSAVLRAAVYDVIMDGEHHLELADDSRCPPAWCACLRLVPDRKGAGRDDLC